VNQITKQGIIGPHCGATIQSVLPPQKYRLPPSLQSFDRAQENEGKLKQGQIFASQAAELPLAFTNIHYFFIQPITGAKCSRCPAVFCVSSLMIT